MRIIGSKLFKITILLFVLSLFTFSVIGITTYYVFAQDLQTKEGIMNKNETGIVLYDRNNIPFFTFYQAKKQKYVPLSEISPNLKNAVVSVEDKDFYKHNGFSLRAIIRSLFLDLKIGRVVYGGSTITQQLVKNSLLNTQKSYLRKFQEIVLAHELEKKYSKNQILEMYLNSVYFGEGAFGAEEASKTYFGKSASKLTLGESALLTGLLPSPSRLSPYSSNWKESFDRQRLVLTKMAEQKFISKSQVNSAQEESIKLNQTQGDINKNAPHFALMIRDELRRKYGEEYVVRSGLKVKTGLDLSWQKYAEKVVAENVAKLAPNRVSNGAAVVLDAKSGEIRALVGSVNWYNDHFGKVNMATSPRQTGSSFKPILYSTALERRVITPATILKDQPTAFKLNEPGAQTYTPHDYDNKFRGNVTVRRALANSLNIPAVEVLSRTGIRTVVDKASLFGINLPDKYYGLSFALGTQEVPLVKLTQAYNVFANQGQFVSVKTITKIQDKNGQIIFENKDVPKDVLEKGVAYQIWSILSDKNTRREIFGNTLDTLIPAAVKTGTTDSYKDAWTMGFTPNLTVGVWVGNNNNRAMDTVAGSLGAAPIWKELIEKFSAEYPYTAFSPPEDLVSVNSCIGLGSGLEYFLMGTQPRFGCASPEVASSKIESTPKQEEKKDLQVQEVSNANKVEEVKQEVRNDQNQNSNQNQNPPPVNPTEPPPPTPQPQEEKPTPPPPPDNSQKGNVQDLLEKLRERRNSQP